MRILFLTQYYLPEVGAAQNRLSDLAKRLAKSGHAVTVLTTLPSYPKGEVYEGYRGRLHMTEKRESVRIVRIWSYVTKKKSFVHRLINYLSYAALALAVGSMIERNADVVIVESPPLFLGFSGYILSKLKNAKFVLNVSDLWPESAVVLDMLRDRRLIRWATMGEEWLYRKANLVTGQTQGIVDSIRRRCPNQGVHLLTNGVAPEFLERVAQARGSRQYLREKFGFGQKSIVAYTGVHGLAQGLETVVSSAVLLRGQTGIRFCFFGDGPQKPHLQSMAAQHRLENVHFYSTLQTSEIAELLASIDVSVVPLKRNELFRGALPSKLFEALGAGVPVVGALNGEAKDLIDKSGGGLCAEPENPEDLAQKLLRLCQDKQLCKRLSENGHAFVSTHYNRKEIANRFELLILALVTTERLRDTGRKVKTCDSPKRLDSETTVLGQTAQSKVNR